MNKKAKWFLVLGSAVLGMGLASSSRAQMTMPGQFAVGPSGAATYAISLRLPPGTSGLEPKLSLSHNSQAGNGLLGVGWNILGLSVIERCPQTKLQDGASSTKAINHDSQDRYCLDGQRLIAVSGADGGAGAEYRTEQETYSKVTSYAETGSSNGPGSFIVNTKDGLTMEYGKTEDSRIEAQGKIDAQGHGVVVVWALNRVTDVKGNYYTVTYTEDNANGQYYPVRMDFTGNASVAPAVSPKNTVYFDYETRPDVFLGYHAGSLLKTTVRLKKIRTTAQSTDSYSYTLTYQSAIQAPMPVVSALQTIQQCNSGTTACLPPTTIGLDTSTGSTYNLTATTNPGDQCTASCGFWISTDVNGDGKADFVHIADDNGRVFTWISNGNGTYQVSVFQSTGDTCLKTCGTWQFGDINGDGKQDLIHLTNDSGQVITWTSNGNGTYQVVAYTGAGDTCVKSCGFWVANDVDGDGKTDLTHFTNDSGQVITWLSKGNGTYQLIAFVAGGDTCLKSCGTWQAGDINGDSKGDFIHMTNDSGQVISWISKGDGTYQLIAFTSAGDTCLKSCGSWQSGDFNGDGKTDLIHLANDTGNALIWLNKGDGTYQVVAYVASGDTCLKSCGKWQLGDINGDGKTDLIHLTNDSGGTIVWLSKGDGSFQLVAYTSTGDTCLKSCGSWQSADVNGDGKTDLVHMSNDAGQLITWISSFGGLGRVTSVSLGTGVTTSISYATLSQALTSGNYVRSLVPVLPRFSPLYPMSVVTTVTMPNGVGGLRSNQYIYGDYVVEGGLTGRGALGFQWMQTKDASTGLVTRTYYRQDFPYLGMVDKVGRGTGEANWSNLSLSTNEYKFTAYLSTDANYANGSTCSDDPITKITLESCATSTIKPLSRYLPYASKVITKSWDWDSGTGAFTALPQSRTTTVLDNWGNATQVKSEALNADGSYSGYSKTTDSSYLATDITNWRLGRLARSSGTATAP